MSAPCGLITLLTDFGLSDPFVGVMKGVILSRFPAARIIDLCHGIAPQSVSEAAFWLERSWAYFPPGSVHVAVVDPTVGSRRRILALSAGGQWFLAPDNGLLGPALLGAPGAEVRALDLARLGLSPASATFHGRDVFAPVAARLASGELPFASVGDPVTPEPGVLPPPARDGDALTGVVVTVDRFGNLITNLESGLVLGSGARRVELGGRVFPLRRTYADVEPGAAVALVNAFDVLELALRDGSAARALGVGRGAAVRLPLAAPPERP